MFTPLMLALIMVESSDLMFAMDSIPAIFAITKDPFIIFSSNVFAILGLRSLYFALAGIMNKLYYLKVSLALLLALVGCKLLLKDVLHTVPDVTYYTLGAMALILTGGIIASLIRAKHMNNNECRPAADRSYQSEPVRCRPAFFLDVIHEGIRY
ncbi:MAG: TerC family protein [Gammaproteobacteria bacterium]